MKVGDLVTVIDNYNLELIHFPGIEEMPTKDLMEEYYDFLGPNYKQHIYLNYKNQYPPLMLIDFRQATLAPDDMRQFHHYAYSNVTYSIMKFLFGQKLWVTIHKNQHGNSIQSVEEIFVKVSKT
jgi:hypothetical protein